MGNAIANDVTAQIANADVSASGNVTVLAKDVAPSIIPDWKAMPKVKLDTSKDVVDTANDTINSREDPLADRRHSHL